ncbi:hypothetical protein ACTM4W_06625 [Citrobacter freundii]|uniref:Uncharacterized protein n=1 Tax=Citrobacter freundii TaxID=546 RepID=A0AAN4EX74_CITFR|nr:hypothetical protein [Citrobacter freundii]
MDRLIHEMSFLFTQKRFMELQDAARDIDISHSDYPECFGLIADAIDEFLEDKPEDEWLEREKIFMHYVAMRSIWLWGKGHKVTDIQWAHPGWFGTAEKGGTIQ